MINKKKASFTFRLSVQTHQCNCERLFFLLSFSGGSFDPSTAKSLVCWKVFRFHRASHIEQCGVKMFVLVCLYVHLYDGGVVM